MTQAVNAPTGPVPVEAMFGHYESGRSRLVSPGLRCRPALRAGRHRKPGEKAH